MFFILIRCFILTIIIVKCSGFAPDMTPDVAEIVLNEGDPLKIQCISLNPIKFYYPSNTSSQFVTSPVDLKGDDRDGVKTVTLDRHVTVYGDTGWYGCADIDVTVTPDVYDEPDVRWLYVYVKSNTTYFVNNEEHEQLHEEVGSKVVLPCRPTIPDFMDVKLYDGYEEQIVNDPRISYDPKIGFIIRNIALKDSGIYKCEIEIGNVKQEANYILAVVRKQEIINQPIIDDSIRHVVLGQTLRINCTINIDADILFDMDWTIPQQNTSRKSTKYFIVGKNTIIATRELTLKDVGYEDEGEYQCKIVSRSATKITKKNITIHDPSIKYINISSQNPDTHYQKKYGESILWIVNVDAYPTPRLQWLDPKGTQITNTWNDNKRGVDRTATSIKLKINHLTVDDMGVYALVASTSEDEKILNFTLEVMSKPILDDGFKNIETYYTPNSEAKIKLRAAGFPLPNITWSFMEHSNDLTSKNQDYKVLKNVSNEADVTTITSIVALKIVNTGTLKANACNILGCDSIEQTIFVSDVPDGFGILAPNEHLAVGDNLEIICGASIYNYSNEIGWTNEDNQLIAETDRLKISKTSTQFTYRSILRIKNIQKSDEQVYICNAVFNDGIIMSAEYRLDINDPIKPYMKYIENMNQTEMIYDPETASDTSIVLRCDIDGMPVPTISWWKDGNKINASDDVYTLVNRNKELHIEHPREKNSGRYLCRGENRLGFVETYQDIRVKGEEISKVLIISIIVLTVICIILVIYFSIKMHREKVMRKQLMEAGLTHFEEGAVECLNSELTIDDQAELLPYDKKWEFPREKLKFGKQLGSGAFGVVMKAEARGLLEHEESTTVAVKMVRRSTEATYIRALASELKIMVHLGKHLNVVNLLGACTKNIAKRELLVIVEYCRFGNLHNYLLRHRSEFINQIDSATGKIDPSIGSEMLKRSVSVGSNNRIKYAALSFSRSISMNSNNANEETAQYTGGSDSQSVTMSPDGPVLSNNSVQLGWRSNYHGDYKDYNLKPICSQDLLSWAFQVARGMEYLSQRKVLHGDLAARNILLAENDVVKICDFGLAKTMYKDDNYQKKGNAPMPIKWMAIESIRDRVFSTQSDIWSFGIVLWEFFTLAETPYPGMEAEKLYQKLIEGYRMEKPEFATQEVYDIMFQCWKAKPSMRPTFTELVQNIGDLLDESVRAHYVDLNTPYMDMNTALFEGKKNDYLTMMSAPDHENLSSPITRDYVNSPSIPISPVTDSSYLCMSPIRKQRDESGIFSPLSTSETCHFDFPTTDNKVVNSDSESEAVELSPMLKPTEDDDNYLTPINVEERRAEFARQQAAKRNQQRQPSKHDNMERDSGYCNAPQNLRFIDLHNEEIKKDTDSNNKTHNDKLNKNNSNSYKAGIIRTQDNYVNMPRNKNEINRDTPDSFTNPSYIFVIDNIDQASA